MQEILNHIDGERVAGVRWFEKRSPVDGRVIARVAEAGAGQVDAAVRAESAIASTTSSRPRSRTPASP